MAAVSNRWATIINSNADGVAEIANISLMEGVEPERNVDAADRYRFEEVEDGVKIGMVQGGSVGAVGGWGFADELTAANRSESGITRIADTKSKTDEANLPPVSHEKTRGEEQASSDEPNESAKADKPAKSKRAAKAEKSTKPKRTSKRKAA